VWILHTFLIKLFELFIRIDIVQLYTFRYVKNDRSFIVRLLSAFGQLLQCHCAVTAVTVPV